MNHGSLFNGIGGFQLAAQEAGWNNVFSCEIDAFCNQVTKYHFPNCRQYGDIRKTNFRKYRGKIDVLTGGFPCQPFSVAGKRLGTEDNRNLWPEMLRVIRDVSPRWVVAENVLGIVSWSKGLVFEQVQADLEAEGYEVQSYVLPAAGVGAPHRRYRVWFVATNSHLSRSQTCKKRQEKGKIRRRDERIKLPRNWENFTTQSPVCGGDDGIPKKLDFISFPKWRREAIKAYGNAIVPQVALQIFKAIKNYEKEIQI